MLEIIAPAIRIMVLWAFTRFATLGYFTPEDATTFTKVTMDVLMYAAPVIYAGWAAWKSTLASRIASIVKSRRVEQVAVRDPALAASIPSNKVVS